MDMTGNVYAINSARRTAEKGAVSDAKREALSNMGRVFRRAFEDGAEALRVIEEKLMERMRAYNAPAKASTAPRVVAAPRLVKGTEPELLPERGDDPEGYLPLEAVEEGASVTPKTQTVEETTEQKEEETSAETTATYLLQTNVNLIKCDNPSIVFDIAIQHLDHSDREEQLRFLETNKTTLLRAEEDDELGELTYQDLVDLLKDDVEETTPVTEDAPVVEGPKLTPEKMTGDAILKAYADAFDGASQAEINAILDANTDLAKRLTKRQKAKLALMALGQ
jgi:hypothetical protein